jgi:hypothetical protein
MRTPEDANFPKLPHKISIMGELLYFRVRICSRVRALASPRLGSRLSGFVNLIWPLLIISFGPTPGY